MIGAIISVAVSVAISIAGLMGAISSVGLELIKAIRELNESLKEKTQSEDGKKEQNDERTI